MQTYKQLKSYAVTSGSSAGTKFSVKLHKMNKNFQRKIVNIFLPINFNIGFGCSKEPSHWDGSFEYPQHIFWLRNKKKHNFRYALYLTKVLQVNVYSKGSLCFESICLAVYYKMALFSWHEPFYLLLMHLFLVKSSFKLVFCLGNETYDWASSPLNYP